MKVIRFFQKASQWVMLIYKIGKIIYPMVKDTYDDGAEATKEIRKLIKESNV